MAARKKISRKEIKGPDEFITMWSRVFEFVAGHRREALGILGGVLALVVLITAWSTYSRSQEHKAMILLSEAQGILGSSLSQGKDQEASGEDFERGRETLRQLVEQYRGSRAAQTGRFLLGHLHYRQGEYDEAIRTYKEFLDRGHDMPEWKALAWEGLAYCYEAQEGYEEAARCYQEASRLSPSYNPGWALLGLARCHEKLGKFAQAAEDYGKLLADYPQHPRAEEARASMARLMWADSGQEGAPPDPGSEIRSIPEDAAEPAPASPPERSK